MNPQFIITKLFRGAMTLLLAVTFVFIVLRASGDPAQMMLSDEASPEAIAAFRKRWGLDGSYIEQYITYLSAIVQGDFGDSFRDGRPALQVVLGHGVSPCGLGAVGGSSSAAKLSRKVK